MPTKIAFYRLYARGLRNDVHCAERASQHAAFTANTMRLFNKDMSTIATNGLCRADIGARRVFTLVAGNGSGEGIFLNHPGDAANLLI